MDVKKYALIGKNIQGSLSPVVHRAYGCEYDLLDVNESELEEVLKLHYDGFNVTAPYKEKIKKFLNSSCDYPVNTIVKSNGKLIGYNTDLIGFLEALQLAGVSCEDKIAILGNGSMGKLLNKVLRNSDMFDGHCYDSSLFKTYYGVVNCTPKQDYDLSYLPKNAWAMDLGYKDDTFVNNAKANGTFAFNGFNMLIIQARESQKLWNKD